jgi:hypothetical protein
MKVRSETDSGNAVPRHKAEVRALTRLKKLKDEREVPTGGLWLSSLPWSMDEQANIPMCLQRGNVGMVASTPVGIPLESVCRCHKSIREVVVERLTSFRTALESAQKTEEKPFKYSFVDLHCGNLALHVNSGEPAGSRSIDDVVRQLKTANAFVVDVESLNRFGRTPERVFVRKECHVGDELEASTDNKNMDSAIKSFEEQAQPHHTPAV